MSYFSWFESHIHKRTQIVTSLVGKGYDKEAMIDYFVFENMIKCEPQFCPLYKNKQKCHDMMYLNCYFCACPYFYFDDNGISVDKKGLVIKSGCRINSKKAKTSIHASDVHLDCSMCFVPHTKAFVRRYFGLRL